MYELIARIWCKNKLKTADVLTGFFPPGFAISPLNPDPTGTRKSPAKHSNPAGTVRVFRVRVTTLHFAFCSFIEHDSVDIGYVQFSVLVITHVTCIMGFPPSTGSRMVYVQRVLFLLLFIPKHVSFGYI